MGSEQPCFGPLLSASKCSTKDTVLLPLHRKIPAVRGTIRTVDISDQGKSKKRCLSVGAENFFGWARSKRRARSLRDKGQERVAAQMDSEVFTASLGALRNTFRWGFYEKLNFL